MNETPPELRAALERAQRAGMLGPEAIDRHVAHALDFLRPFELAPGAVCVDLGSGGGVPGLPLALANPATRWSLVDAWLARCEHLERAVRDLGLADRVSVVHARAEELAHGPLRGTVDVVTARSFGPLALTVEASGAFLCIGGRLVVSVVHDATVPAEVPELGLATEAEWETAHGSFRSLVRTGAGDPRFPRRPAAQRRAPLF